ncbi:MAG: GspE/PulE family protein [Opitutales bacterium]
MVTNAMIQGEEAFLNRLTEEQRLQIESLPRQKRLTALAEIMGVSEQEALTEMAQAYELPVLLPEEAALKLAADLPARLLSEYQCLPAKEGDNGTLHLTTVWPPDPEMDEWIYALCGKEVAWSLAPPEKINNFITQHFGVGFDSLDDTDLAADGLIDEAEDEEDESAAIVRFVNEVVAQAVEDAATDIHVEPQEETLRIRYRIDGLLLPIPVPENLRRFQDAIIARIKIMSRLNISERRLPQDGRINFRVGENILDIRVSTIPTMYGESVSLRLLNKKALPFTLDQMGMLDKDQDMVYKILQRPHGIILVTGPTGSGKSTSLNAFVRQINSAEKRIITIEDPIEYEVPGVNQMQVRPEIGLHFADGLRHILRQDPDIIMVGEIRDRDTADIAIRASLTGHLVLSTLHTNDAPGALTRLIDMGIEPFLVASAVELVIAQRLIRRLCSACKTLVAVDPVELRRSLTIMELDPAEADTTTELMAAVGCERCRNTGFRGRLGIFEILRVDESLHDLITTQESTRVIRKRALDNGMRDLRLSGWEQVKLGHTRIEEVLRVTTNE